jgi:hypothetical protein
VRVRGTQFGRLQKAWHSEYSAYKTISTLPVVVLHMVNQPIFKTLPSTNRMENSYGTLGGEGSLVLRLCVCGGGVYPTVVKKF